MSEVSDNDDDVHGVAFPNFRFKQMDGFDGESYQIRIDWLMHEEAITLLDVIAAFCRKRLGANVQIIVRDLQ